MVGSKVPLGAVRATRALLDFLYLAQYRSHSDDTLRYLREALDDFHKHKDVFLNLNIREDFDLSKLHSLQHYVLDIPLFGCTNNYNTETTERLHIDFVKDVYRASNKKQALEQMGRWLLCRKAIVHFDAYISWRMQDFTRAKMKSRRRELKHAPGTYIHERDYYSSRS